MFFINILLTSICSCIDLPGLGSKEDARMPKPPPVRAAKPRPENLINIYLYKYTVEFNLNTGFLQQLLLNQGLNISVAAPQPELKRAAVQVVPQQDE
jgi:hypothetical protein